MSKFDDEWGRGDGSRRKAGRPKGASRHIYKGKCDVRLTAEEDFALSRLAEKNEVTRSDVMRRALRDYLKFNESSGE